MTKPEAIETLKEIKDYMDDRSDIHIHDPNNGNREMRFSTFLQSYIEALEEKQEPEIVLIATKVRVVKNECQHYFKIGEIVEVTNYDPSDKEFPYLCCKDSAACWLSREEFEIVEQ